MDPLDAPTLDPNKTNPFSISNDLIPESLFGKFGKYQIIEKIGQGGMGAVYRAKDSILGRMVAIKVPLLRGLDKSVILGRFSREAIAAATLNHPTICPIFEFSEFQGIPYIVAPYLNGCTLQDILDRDGAWGVERSLQLCIRLAEGLAFAHQAEVIHRDIKPQNIFIDDNSSPVILDFGLAKIAQGSSSNWTQSGEVVGTPAYMPPEQIDNSLGPISASSDIYALGMTLYRLITGRTGFLGDASFIIPQILMDRPRAPSSIKPELQSIEGLDPLLLKPLEKKPCDRFSSMKEFATNMESLLHRLRNSSNGLNGPSVPLPELRILGSGYRYRPLANQQSIRVGRQRASSNQPNVLMNDLVLRADSDQERTLRISRQHLEIVATQKGLAVIDRSSAGITINGRQARKGELEPLRLGDVIGVAGVLDIEVLPATQLPIATEVKRNEIVGYEVTMGDLYKEASD